MPNPNPNPSYSNAQTQEGLISEARILRAAQEVNAVVALECSSRNDINIDLVLNILARVGYDYAQIKLAQSNQRQIPSVSGHKRGCIIS